MSRVGTTHLWFAYDDEELSVWYLLYSDMEVRSTIPGSLACSSRMPAAVMLEAWRVKPWGMPDPLDFIGDGKSFLGVGHSYPPTYILQEDGEHCSIFSSNRIIHRDQQENMNLGLLFRLTE